MIDVAAVFGFEGWQDPEELAPWGWDFAVVGDEFPEEVEFEF